MEINNQRKDSEMNNDTARLAVPKKYEISYIIYDGEHKYLETCPVSEAEYNKLQKIPRNRDLGSVVRLDSTIVNLGKDDSAYYIALYQLALGNSNHTYDTKHDNFELDSDYRIYSNIYIGEVD